MRRTLAHRMVIMDPNFSSMAVTTRVMLGAATITTVESRTDFTNRANHRMTQSPVATKGPAK